MKKWLYPLSMFLMGVIFTLAALFVLMAFDRVIPASQEYQQACPKLSESQIKSSFINSWFRMAGKSESMEAIGLSNIRFETNPVFADNSWSGELKVVGEKGHYSANVILDCYNGYFDYTGPFDMVP
ncbi:hypothetical protein QMZ30_11500 [Pantoea sp. EA-12]|uniref:hypothetical protein n=1 Tax=Pantoea sp. EA-12 TaxID=3043303 RepID=UPI0024B5C394|nr:hypothetical protein [Pantoea sp. EA-12]MDI9221526.1 hypothetical protein [Pantoea sp. EA-12]